MERPRQARRQYGSSGRQQRARRNGQAIADAAERLFLEHGYTATSLATMARDAGVSSELIYKAFGGKSGLVQAPFDRHFAGTAPVPAAAVLFGDVRGLSGSSRSSSPPVSPPSWPAAA